MKKLLLPLSIALICYFNPLFAQQERVNVDWAPFANRVNLAAMGVV